MNTLKKRTAASVAKARPKGYMKIVEWSPADGCFVGSAPPLIGAACHGQDEVQVYAELCGIVEEWLTILRNEGMPVPAPMLQKRYSGKFNLRVGQELHKALEIRAIQNGESLNAHCVKTLAAAVGRRAARVRTRKMD